MGLFSRSRSRPGTLRSASSADLQHLDAFASSRAGVVAYLEPRTAVTDSTVVLVAATGEWTRRRVPDPEAAEKFARKRGIPLYDAARVGYPARMREWNATQKAGETSGA